MVEYHYEKCALRRINKNKTDKILKGNKMEYVLLVILLIAAIAIVAAVLFQKDTEGGLSSTIAGGSDTYYGKEKSGGSDKLLFKITVIAAIVFVVAVLVAYIAQPDYAGSISGIEKWYELLPSKYHELFDSTHSH